MLLSKFLMFFQKKVGLDLLWIISAKDNTRILDPNDIEISVEDN